MTQKDLLYRYATDSNLKTYHYKVLFLLKTGDMTQANICKELGVSKQNLNKIIKELESIGYIKVHHEEGRNKYYQIDNNPNLQLKGQQAFEFSRHQNL